MLTESEIESIRDVVGDSPSDEELQTIHARVGDLGGVVYSVLSRRLAELVQNPANFNVAGEYSQDTRTNIEALQKKLEEYAAFAPSASGLSQVSVIEPTRRRRR